MRPTKFPEASRVLQAPVGMTEDDCTPLYVYDGLVTLAGPEQKGREIPCLLSKWELDDEDRARIAAGAPVWLWVYGAGMPPVALETDDPFSRERKPHV
jgi:hypothetical protein